MTAEATSPAVIAVNYGSAALIAANITDDVGQVIVVDNLSTPAEP